MKRLFAVLLILFLISMELVACTGSEQTGSATERESVSESVTGTESGSTSETETGSETGSETEQGSETTSETDSETASETDAPVILPALLITEVGFDPTYQENDYGLSTGADVFEFFELYNPGNESVCIADYTMLYRKNGFDKEAKTNRILGLPGSDMVIPPQGMAILAIYRDHSVTVELGYETAEEIEEFREAFNEFYGTEVPAEAFFICPHYESGEPVELEGTFDLANSVKLAVYQLCDAEGNVVSEVSYETKYWDRNDRAQVFVYLGGTEEHPLLSDTIGCTIPTPYELFANQIPGNPALVAPGSTVAVNLVEYNICASGIDWAWEWKDQIPDADSENYESMMENLSKRDINYRAPLLCDAIRSQAPGVVVLCEVNYYWIPLLQQYLIETGEYMAHGYSGNGVRYDEMTRGQWDLCNLILWDPSLYTLVDSGFFWVSATPDVMSRDWYDGISDTVYRTANWVILREKETGTEFFLQAAHLIAGAENHNPELRIFQAGLLAEKMNELAGGRPALMSGDWNATMRSPAYQISCAAHPDAAFRTADTWIGGSTNSWGKQLEDYQSRLPIDHVFITPETVFVDYFHVLTWEYAPGLCLSDHDMVSCRLQILAQDP